MTERDITPGIELITALRNQDWTPHGAISELVDNSLGAARGNATQIDIEWQPRKRILTVLDNGNGMKDVGDLFQLAKTAGRSPRDIGKYGVGGTMALLWLADVVELSTKAGNYISSAHVDWDFVVNWGKWTIEQENWVRASLENTPSALLGEKHGTLIRLLVPKGKRLNENSIRSELTFRYAPGLRQGRRIRWTVGDNTEEMAPPPGLPDPIDIQFAIPMKDADLWVQGVIGIDPALGPKQSTIAIGFGHRVVMTTKDCYEAPDKSRNYTGLGVAGWIDLGEGWQDYLTMAKTEFTDADLKDRLMAHLFEKLEPLLKEREEAREELQLENVALNLSVRLEEAFDVDVAVAPRDPQRKYKWTKHGSDMDVPDIESRRDPEAGSEPGEGAHDKKRDRARIWLDFLGPKQMKGTLWEVEVRGTDIWVHLDKDNEYVKQARKTRSPVTDMLLGSLAIPAVSAALLDLFGEERLRHDRILRPVLLDQLELKETHREKIAFLTGHLLEYSTPA